MDDERRMKGVRDLHKESWTRDRNEHLMMCLFSGLPIRGTYGLLNLVGTTWKGVSRQLYKVAQNYSEKGKRKPPEIQLAGREGTPWSTADYWVMSIACNKVGREHDADTPEHISRVLGRSKEEVRGELLRIAKSRRGFSLANVSASERVSSVLAELPGVIQLEVLIRGNFKSLWKEN